MADVNRTGRGKREKLTHDQQYQKVHHGFLKEPAFLAMSYGARCLYFGIKSLHDGYNNGRIMCSIRFAADLIGSSESSAVRFLTELQEHGFIVRTERGQLGVHGQGRGAQWLLTELPAWNEKHAQRDYRDWRPKNKTPYLGSVQGPPRMSTGKASNTPKMSTGHPYDRYREGGISGAEHTYNRCNLIDLPWEGRSFAPASVSGEGDFLGKPSRHVAAVSVPDEREAAA